jgi:hypothetical protein
MATVPDSQPLQYEEVQESEEDISRHLLADISIIYGATLPAELASKQHPIPTPPQGSSHPSLETSQQMQHHPDHDYGSLKEYNSYLDDGPSRNKIPIHREDLQISRPSSCPSSSRIREGWAHEDRTSTSWELSSVNSRDSIISSQSPHGERKRPFDSSAGSFYYTSLFGHVTQKLPDHQSVKRRKTSARDARSPPSASGREPRQSTGGLNSPGGVCFSDEPRTRSLALLPEDYNSWEAGISVEEIRDLRRGFSGSGSL